MIQFIKNKPFLMNAICYIIVLNLTAGQLAYATTITVDPTQAETHVDYSGNDLRPFT